MAVLLIIGLSAGILAGAGGIGLAFNKWNRRRRMRNWNYNHEAYKTLEEDYDENYHH